MVALFVLLFVILVISADAIIQFRKKKHPLASAALSLDHERENKIRVPKGIFFHPGHTWARILSDDTVQVGIDEFLQRAIGGIERITPPKIGDSIKQGEAFMTVQQADRVLHLAAPVSGTVLMLNHDALEHPEILNDNPYRSGWLCVIEPVHLASNLQPLTIAEDALHWLKREIVRLRDFILGEVQQPEAIGVTALDGGVPIVGSLTHLEKESWTKFERDFLRVGL